MLSRIGWGSVVLSSFFCPEDCVSFVILKMKVRYWLNHQVKIKVKHKKKKKKAPPSTECKVVHLAGAHILCLGSIIL